LFTKSASEKSLKNLGEDTRKVVYVYDSGKSDATEKDGTSYTKVSVFKWKDTITFVSKPDQPTELGWWIVTTSIDANGKAVQSHHVMNVDTSISGFWQLYGKCSK
jgi:hypothetical protein